MITANQIHAAKILIVDDMEANVALLEGILRRDGYTSIQRTLDGREVCELHRLHQFDLILLDLQMPVMDGFEVMTGLQALEADGYLPVLVITAQPGHLLRALRAGARDFISKPFDLAEVLMRVHNLLEVRLLHKELVGYTKQLVVRNELICETFGRYLSDEVMESLVALPDVIKLGGDTHRVTMMKADLRGFTAASLADGLPPEQVAMAINNYLDKMVEILLDHGGTIDGFTGDGLLGLFGAPQARPGDAERAVACAVAMQLAMVQVNALNQQMGLTTMAMGVGVHTGDVVLGNIGTSARAKYGALGNAVSLTARIEMCTVAGEVLVSGTTLDTIRDLVDLGPMPQVVANGMEGPMSVYAVLGMRGKPELTLPKSAQGPATPSPTLGA
jgi:adenylate cyclase